MLSIIINEPQNELLQFSAYSGLVFLAFFNFNIIVVQYITLFNVMVLTNGKNGEALKLHWVSLELIV